MRQLIAALVLFPAAVAAQTQSGSDAQTTALAYGHRIPVLSAQAARRTGPIVLEAGGPSRFGHLEGLHIPAATSRLELLPYDGEQVAVARGDSGRSVRHPRPSRLSCRARHQGARTTCLGFGRDRTALLAAKPDNIFLVEASWWLSR